MFRLHWQDFTGRAPGDKPPEMQHRDFPTREEAVAAQRTLRAGPNAGADMITTITPTPMPKPRKARGAP